MKRLFLLPALLAGFSLPAHAEVKAVGDNGFNVFHAAEVDAPPAVVWKRLMTPKDWWNPKHSWSQSTAGFYIEPKVGGCFCEAIQEKNAAGKVITVGGVEHMRVIYYHPEHVLRMQGGLGPLQGEAVFGVLTVALAPTADGKGTKVSFSYNVGGYMRQGVTKLSGAVDGVIGEQFQNMVKVFAKPAATPAAAVAKPEEKKEWSLDVDKLTGEKAAPATTEEATGEPTTTGEVAPEGEPNTSVGDAIDAMAVNKPVKPKPAPVKPAPKERPVPENPEEAR